MKCIVGDEVYEGFTLSPPDPSRSPNPTIPPSSSSTSRDAKSFNSLKLLLYSNPTGRTVVICRWGDGGVRGRGRGSMLEITRENSIYPLPIPFIVVKCCDPLVPISEKLTPDKYHNLKETIPHGYHSISSNWNICIELFRYSWGFWILGIWVTTIFNFRHMLQSLWRMAFSISSLTTDCGYYFNWFYGLYPKAKLLVYSLNIEGSWD